MSLIERDRAKALDAMTNAIGVRSKVRDAVGDMLDAALDSGALVWASNHQGAVEAAARTVELEAALEAPLDGDERLAEYAEAVAALRAAIGGQQL
jgi:hypothetical protein